MKKFWQAILGGVLITVLLIVGNMLTPDDYPKVLNMFFWSVFWSAGIFGTFFDYLIGTKSIWMPNPLALLTSWLLSVFIYSIPVYVFLSVRLRDNRLRNSQR